MDHILVSLPIDRETANEGADFAECSYIFGSRTAIKPDGSGGGGDKYDAVYLSLAKSASMLVTVCDGRRRQRLRAEVGIAEFDCPVIFGIPAIHCNTRRRLAL